MKLAAMMILVLPLTSSGEPPDTNVYVPLMHGSPLTGEARALTTERQLQLAKKLPECRPAELDPEGHWGSIAAGLQLSVRFSTNVLQAGKQIDTFVILRNTSTNIIVIPCPVSWLLELSVKNEKQEELVSTNQPRTFFGGGYTRLPGRSQDKHSLLLNELADMAVPGDYYVTARMIGSKIAELPPVASGTAKITIIPANPK